MRVPLEHGHTTPFKYMLAVELDRLWIDRRLGRHRVPEGRRGRGCEGIGTNHEPAQPNRVTAVR